VRFRGSTTLVALSISVKVIIRASGETRFAIVRRPASITVLVAGLLVKAR
jgi:hypothetical protein